MAHIPHNIESRVTKGHAFKFHGHCYRVGYAKSSGEVIKIYGDSRRGYNVAGKYCHTLSEVSAHLETL